MKTLFNGEKLFFPKHRAGQMFSAVIVTAGRRAVIFDGGCAEDAPGLLDRLAGFGVRKVDAWLLTHPHADHVNALEAILRQQPEALEIGAIYHAFPPLAFTLAHRPRGYQVQAGLEKTLAGARAEVVRVKPGDAVEADGVSVNVLHTCDLGDPQLAEDLNAASTVYRAEIAGVSFLVLGDISGNAAARLAETRAGQLASDIVQMAHHGQGGGSEALYRLIRPRIAVWPTPEWLWENMEPGDRRGNRGGYSSGNFSTNQTKVWLEKIGVREHYVVTTDILFE